MSRRNRTILTLLVGAWVIGGALVFFPALRPVFRAPDFTSVNELWRAVTFRRSCDWIGRTGKLHVLHGAKVTMFRQAVVPFGDACESEARECLNGRLTGSYEESQCRVAAAADCTFGGRVIKHGASVRAYRREQVAFGQECEWENRSCLNGSLTGNYGFPTCRVEAAKSCVFNGSIVSHGATVTAYKANTVPSGKVCEYEQRTCNDGNLSGSFAFGECTMVALSPTPLLSPSPAAQEWSSLIDGRPHFATDRGGGFFLWFEASGTFGFAGRWGGSYRGGWRAEGPRLCFSRPINHPGDGQVCYVMERVGSFGWRASSPTYGDFDIYDENDPAIPVPPRPF